MNQPVRNLDTGTSVATLAALLSNPLTEFESDVRTESGLVAALARAWFDRRADRSLRKLDLLGHKNRPNREMQQTEATVVDPASVFKRPNIHRDVLRRPQPMFVPLQEWEGYVVKITDSHVLANLLDLASDATRPDQQAEIPLQEFSDDDIPKLSVGKVFRWAIGYQRSPTGTKMRVSQIIVRDLPQWSRRELAEAKDEARELHKFFNRD